jgi:hypothetical protein
MNRIIYVVQKDGYDGNEIEAAFSNQEMAIRLAEIITDPERHIQYGVVEVEFDDEDCAGFREGL